MKHQSIGTSIALVSVFAALIAALSIAPPLFMIGAVPFAIQLIAVILAPLVLGPILGASANAIYLLVGFAGLPVFAKQTGGIQSLFSPTGGYLIGYAVGALAAGCVASIVLKKWTSGWQALVGLCIAGLVGIVLIHALGILGMMINAKIAFSKAFSLSVGFVPLDCVKVLLAAIIALAIFKAFPRLSKSRF